MQVNWVMGPSCQDMDWAGAQGDQVPLPNQSHDQQSLLGLTPMSLIHIYRHSSDILLSLQVRPNNALSLNLYPYLLVSIMKLRWKMEVLVHLVVTVVLSLLSHPLPFSIKFSVPWMSLPIYPIMNFGSEGGGGGGGTVFPLPGSFPWAGGPRGKPRRGMMRRAVFSDLQRKGLEKRFQIQKYISKPDRKKLAEKLGLKDSQVKNHLGFLSLSYSITRLFMNGILRVSISWNCSISPLLLSFIQVLAQVGIKRGNICIAPHWERISCRILSGQSRVSFNQSKNRNHTHNQHSLSPKRKEEGKGNQNPARLRMRPTNSIHTPTAELELPPNTFSLQNNSKSLPFHYKHHLIH